MTVEPNTPAIDRQPIHADPKEIARDICRDLHRGTRFAIGELLRLDVNSSALKPFVVFSAELEELIAAIEHAIEVEEAQKIKAEEPDDRRLNPPPEAPEYPRRIAQ